MRVWSGLSRAAAVVVAAATVAGSAGAQITTFMATMSGANESPGNASTGTGLFTARYDASTFTLSLTETWSGLISPTSISHIHCCTSPGSNVGVSTPLPSFPGFPAGVLAGTYSNSFDLSVATSFNPAFVTAQGGLENARDALIAGMSSGRAYINIHTQQFPGGEIRGFITATPEPSTYVLMATGLAAVAGVQMRRRRRA